MGVFKRKNAEVLYTLIVNLSLITAGIALTWSSSAIYKFRSIDNHKNPLERILTVSEQSYLASSVMFGAFLAPFPAAYIAMKFGRKPIICIGSIFFTIGISLILSAQDMFQMLAGRVIEGLGVGVVVTQVAIYVGEISSTGRRGTLGSILQLFFAFGVLIYVLLDRISLYVMAESCCLLFPFIAFMLALLVPETPYYLISTTKKAEAIRSLVAIRGTSKPAVVPEYNEIEEIVNVVKRKGVFVDLFKVQGIRRALVICIGLIFFQQFSGVPAIFCYLKSILDSSSVGDPDHAAIIIAVCMVLCCFITPWIASFCGRRSMLIFSTVGMSMSLLVFAMNAYWIEVGNTAALQYTSWIPVTMLSLYMIFYCLGLGPIPWVVIGELFPPYIKPMAAAVVSCFCWACAFLVSFFYRRIEDGFGTSNCFYCFSLICLSAVFFILVAVMETKGLSLAEIQKALNQREQQ